jgi:hypothetical protein
MTHQSWRDELDKFDYTRQLRRSAWGNAAWSVIFCLLSLTAGFMCLATFVHYPTGSRNWGDVAWIMLSGGGAIWFLSQCASSAASAVHQWRKAAFICARHGRMQALMLAVLTPTVGGLFLYVNSHPQAPQLLWQALMAWRHARGTSS